MLLIISIPREEKMTLQVHCPVCSSDEVYSLLHTLHCKRCGNIWKEEKDSRPGHGACGYVNPASNPVRLTKNTDTLETRMEKRLNENLDKFKGKFSIEKISGDIGNIQMAMFRRYLKNCVRNRTLAEKKDKYGIIWYSRPD